MRKFSSSFVALPRIPPIWQEAEKREAVFL